VTSLPAPPARDQSGETRDPDGVRAAPEARPILEFDPDPVGIIDPRAVLRPADVPARVVLCYFQDVIERAVADGRGRRIATLRSEIGENPVWELERDGTRVGVVHPGVGAPLAAAFLEELVALGCRAFVAAGGAGSLVPRLALGRVIVAIRAIRDEGTSYHYLPPAREVNASPDAVAAIVATLERRRVPFVSGATWTTPFRSAIRRPGSLPRPALLSRPAVLPRPRYSADGRLVGQCRDQRPARRVHLSPGGPGPRAASRGGA